MVGPGTNRDVVDRVRHELEDRLGLHFFSVTGDVVEVVVAIGAFYFFEALHLTFRIEAFQRFRAFRSRGTTLLFGNVPPEQERTTMGRDVGAAGAGVGKAAPQEVDKTSYAGLLSWFKVRGKGGGRFDQVARDLGTDPEAKLSDFADALVAGKAAGTVQTALVPGWNVLVWESPEELTAEISRWVASSF